VNYFNVEVSSELTGNERESKYRQVCYLLATPIGTIPTDREFGIDADFLGRPTEVARAMYAAAVVAAIAKFIDGVKVKSVSWAADADGGAKPEVVIEDG